MNILLTGAFNYNKAQLKKIESLGYDITFIQDEFKPIDFDVSNISIVVCNNLFLNNDIKMFKMLKVIQTTSAGLDRIPTDYAAKHNIKVFNAGNTYSIPMAEFALMQLLNIYKNNKLFIKNQREKIWCKNRRIIEVSNINVLIMGYGNVGKEVSVRLKPLVNHIYAYDIKKYDDKTVEFVDDYREVLDKVDSVIITLPLTTNTHHLVNRDFIYKLKDNVSLINLSRGKIIKEKDLIYSLNNNKFLGVSLDVFEEEPLNKASELWDFDNVYITPHNSFVSNRNDDRLFEIIYSNISKAKDIFNKY